MATGCAEHLKSLPAKLQRVRENRLAHPPGTRVFQQISEEFAKAVRSISDDASFLLDHVEINFESGGLANPEMVKWLFIGVFSVLFVPHQRVEEATAALMAMISNRAVGKLIRRDAIFRLVTHFQQFSLPAPGPAQPEIAIVPMPQITPVEVQPYPEEQLEPKPGRPSEHPAACMITVFPGNCVLLHLPGQRLGLIDCGRKALPTLIPQMHFHKQPIDFVAITHWHLDHFDGVVPLLESLGGTIHPRRIYLPSIHSSENRAASRLLDYCQDLLRNPHSEAQVYRLESYGESMESVIYESRESQSGDTVTVSAVSPSFVSNVTIKTRRVDPNDDCTLFRIAAGSSSFLITGDMTLRRWDEILGKSLEPRPFAKAAGLILPHHGSRNSLNRDTLSQIVTSPRFIAVVEPNRIYGLPHGETLDLVTAAGGVIRTCVDEPVRLGLSSYGLSEE